MKASVAKIYTNLVADVKKALAYLAAQKAAKAIKKLDSIVSKAEKKLSKAKSASKKPRKPNAFALYVKANRKAVANANPDLKSTDIMKLLGKMYKGEAAVPKSASKKASAKKSASPKKAPVKRAKKAAK